MSGQFWRCTTREQLENCFRFLRESIPANGFRISWEPWRDRRSVNSNALYWSWLTLLAAHFSRSGTTYSKDDMHDLMRHKFLGYEDRVIGNTEIRQQLASTSKLDTTQMYHYMSQIDAWGADHGCLLPRPEDEQYEKYREAAA